MGYSAMLSSNARTILLGLCMLANVPVAFFLLEITLLNLLLILSIRKSRAAQQTAVRAMRSAIAGGAITP